MAAEMSFEQFHYMIDNIAISIMDNLIDEKKAKDLKIEYEGRIALKIDENTSIILAE